MLTKQERELKRRTLKECRLNGVTITQGLIHSKVYAGRQAIWAEDWIASRQRPRLMLFLLIFSIAVAILAWAFPRT